MSLVQLTDLKESAAVAAMCAGAAAVVVPAGDAAATGWGTVDAYCQDQGRGSAWGYFCNAANVYAVTECRYWDAMDDGNNVCATNKHWWYKTSEGVPGWYEGPTQYAPEIGGVAHGGEVQELVVGLSPNASSARGEIYACVQLGWPVPDSCSIPAVPSFDY